ncbi:pyrrolo-quinoline quinone [Siphonobacter sp. BAB-5405]|uniref:outer membrane protein assembly factor BamB family protein n=1 Tax=Siphonobacter sp. BAB-5405 TaxID=1864825 RepID=UPI000C800081|nr:PQQ-binding-like beta-propeller repeat protein [Siphonobacter sp. BAB-5405]PMD95867.1 pyrrolo-quinoline quinone [Siphonobacter sp. BAB-5405]
MNRFPRWLLLLGLAIPFFNHTDPGTDYSEWNTYGGHADASRYSSLTQITPENVSKLQLAWEYHTGQPGQMQCQPIAINGTLYFTTANINVVAVAGATGKERWRTDLSDYWKGENAWAGTNRGVTYWKEGEEQRIFVSAGPNLFCLDARTGKPVESFGSQGKIDLQEDLDYDQKSFFIVSNTPGIIYKDVIIMGMRLSEGLDAAPGHVRAYDVRTGKRRWIFHTIPKPGEFGYDTWQDKRKLPFIGGVNNWAGMSLDEKRGIVYVPTGSATYDFYGGYRKGKNLFANCILALDAATGKRIWHYQTVHHDLWDRDLPANPNLVTFQKDGQLVEAVAQITKHGFVFVLDRATGKPVYPIPEKSVPMASELAGEQTWPTQPMPSWPEPFMRQAFHEKDIIDLSNEHHTEILQRFRTLKNGANTMWEPPSRQGGILFPGFDGGGEWGGAAFDPESQYLYVNANEMPWTVTMVENKPTGNAGQQLYASNCANCHGLDRKGNGSIPAIDQVEAKYKPSDLATLLKTGRGSMPSFNHLSESNRSELVAFLLKKGSEKKEVEAKTSALTPPYLMTGYSRFTTKDGYPGIKPPWGTLNAIDLNTGKIAWKVPLGEYAALKVKGIPATGTENYGGPAVTAGGVLFIAATKDEKFRAFDKKTGRLLWETSLPAAGYATPCVYQVDGKQYVVIAAGGNKVGTKPGDSYLAFALP